MGLATLGEYIAQSQLQDVMKEDQKKKLTRDYQKVKPVFIRKLYDKIKSYNAVGERMKVSGGTISESLRINEATGIMEELAKSIWFLEYEQQENPEIIAMIKIKNSELEDFKNKIGEEYFSRTVIWK